MLAAPATPAAAGQHGSSLGPRVPPRFDVLPPPRYIEVITCGRVGRLENPFHFVASEPPRPGTAFASQAPLTLISSRDPSPRPNRSLQPP